ncbi:MAG: hypothetical protein E7426_07480 [Ruminococcaceae bacterium]|jgi:hypothetical protein|nr:hypothetical protein [Oscillospiraceae bacterium]
MADRKRGGRRDYLNDFHMDLSGQYVYTGALYRYAGTLPRRKAMLRTGLMAAAMAVFTVVAGCLDAPAMFGTAYVLLPYLGQVIAAALSVWAAGQLIVSGKELRAYVYRATVEKLPRRLRVTAVFAAVGILGNVVYLCLYGFGGKVLPSLAVLVLHALTGVAAELLRRFFLTLRWDSGSEELPSAGEGRDPNS